MSAGIEETVSLEFYAPQKGARLISGIGSIEVEMRKATIITDTGNQAPG